MKIGRKLTTSLNLLSSASLLLSAGIASASAADLSNKPNVTEPLVNERINRTWEFMLAPYFIAANISGTSQVGRLPSTDIDIGTGDILENLRFGGMIHAEALYNQKFGGMLDVAYMNLGGATDTPRSGGRIRVGVGQLIVEGMLFTEPTAPRKRQLMCMRVGVIGISTLTLMPPAQLRATSTSLEETTGSIRWSVFAPFTC